MDLTPLPQHEGQTPSTALYASTSDVYRWSSKLSQIQHRFCNVTNQASTTVSLLNELGNIDRALLSWCHDVPMDCRPGEEIVSSGNTGQLLVSLHLDYFNMVRAVHWASLTCAHAKRSVVASHPNPRIRGSEAICLSAARSFIKTLNELSSRCLPNATFATNFADRDQRHNTSRKQQLQHSLVRRVHGLEISFVITDSIHISPQTDYLMGAISVLYRNIFKYPHRMSAKADVEHLRAGKIHFERHASSADIVTTLDNLFQAMLTSAERVTSKDPTPEGVSSTITVAEPT